MNYEKRYKEILAKARTFYKKWDGVDAYNSSLAISELKEIFPELQDSENEDTRQSLIDYLRERQSCESYGQYVLRYDRWITWLEKQGQGEQRIAWSEEDEYLLDETTRHLEELIRIEKAKHCGIDVQYYQRDIDWLKSLKKRVQPKQGEPKDNNSIDPHFGKSNDNVEPKFHGGDFIKHNTAHIICKVITVNSDSYYIESVKTGCKTECFSAEQNFHLWNIDDAKEGDILYSPKHDLLWIYKNKDEYHVATNSNFISVESLIEISSDVRPATKEQRDFLFQKMKVYGYEWHDDKKEVIRLDVTEW